MLVTQLKRDHKTLARVLFTPMSSSEFDAFGREVVGVIDRLRAHLDAKASNSQHARQ